MTSTGKYVEDFEHLECIGIGGYGVVFKARDKLLDITYAIKRIPIRHDSEDGKQRALKEAKALASLDHPNIVKFNTAWMEEPLTENQEELDKELFAPFSSEYAIGSTKLSTNSASSHELKKRYLYIQMELCEKGNLKDWLFSPKRTPILCMKIFKQILSAVDYIHNRKLIHRDLKTTNIFFSSEEKIKIGDFGLVTYNSNCCHDSGCSETMEIQTGYVGTKLYMSPEMMARKQYDSKVDVYSLGLIFYELLVPFQTEMERMKSLTDVKKNHFSAAFKKKFRLEYEIIQQMLLEDPSKRITAAKVMEKLEAEMDLKCNAPHLDRSSLMTEKYLEMQPSEFKRHCKFNLSLLITSRAILFDDHINEDRHLLLCVNKNTKKDNVQSRNMNIFKGDIALIKLKLSHFLVIKHSKFPNGKYQIELRKKKLTNINKSIFHPVGNSVISYILVHINVEYENTISHSWNSKNHTRIFKVYSHKEEIAVQEVQAITEEELAPFINLDWNCKLVPSHNQRVKMILKVTKELQPNVTLFM